MVQRMKHYLGIKYFKSENYFDNYCIFAHGETKEGVKNNLDKVESSGNGEKYKYFEYEIQVSLTLHKLLKSEYHEYSYNKLLWVHTELKNILDLKFPVQSVMDFKL